MLRNIIFIVLFVALYGGAYLLFFNNDSTLVDRNGYGELTETHYDCERFSMEMDFEPEWLVFDGAAIKESALNSYTQAELEEAYGCPMNELAFIAGAAAPEAEFFCMSYLNYNAPSSDFDESSMRVTLDNMKNAISGQGGTVGSAACKTITLSNGNKMLVYYYDYNVNGSYYSTFYCFTNVGRDMVFIEGIYENPQGLLMLTDFVENKLDFYSLESANV